MIFLRKVQDPVRNFSLTRGCNKRCQFCVVPKKEGKLVSNYASFDDFVPRGQRNVMLLDNNVLASPNSHDILRNIIKRQFNVNFNQTLDIQYLNDDNYELLMQTRSVNSRFTKKMIYFSCNTPKQADWFHAKSDYLRGFGRNQVTVVIMFGFNTKLSEDFAILKMAKNLGLIPFVQEYQPILGVAPRIPRDFFDMDLDEIAEFRFRTNGRNGEKFLRYINEQYFHEFGRYYLPILKAIYRYNNKPRLQYYLERPHLLTEQMYWHLPHNNQMKTLKDFIARAINNGADGISIEYKNGYEEISLLNGNVGIGITQIKSNSSESAALFDELPKIEKLGYLMVENQRVLLDIATYDDFGEYAYKITILGSAPKSAH